VPTVRGRREREETRGEKKRRREEREKKVRRDETRSGETWGEDCSLIGS
jgi:hypothetical protein